MILVCFVDFKIALKPLFHGLLIHIPGLQLEGLDKKWIFLQRSINFWRHAVFVPIVAMENWYTFFMEIEIFEKWIPVPAVNIIS